MILAHRCEPFAFYFLSSSSKVSFKISYDEIVMHDKVAWFSWFPITPVQQEDVKSPGYILLSEQDANSLSGKGESRFCGRAPSVSVLDYKL